MADDALKGIIDKAVAAGHSDDDIRLLVQEHKRRTPAEAPAPKPAPRNNVERFMQQYPDVQPMGTPIVPTAGIASVAKAAVPGIRALGSKVLGIMSKPSVGGTIGAIEGYRQSGDITGTVVGGMAGAAGSKQLGSMRGASGAAQAPKRLIDTLKDPAEFRDAVNQREALRTLTERLRTQPPKPRLVPKPTPREALTDELIKRDIDWRTTDAVPIDAMKRAQGQGGTILEAGESQIGLGERLAAAMKKAAAGDPAAAKEAELLARALRQRMHIRSDKSQSAP